MSLYSGFFLQENWSWEKRAYTLTLNLDITCVFRNTHIILFSLNNDHQARSQWRHICVSECQKNAWPDRVLNMETFAHCKMFYYLSYQFTWLLSTRSSESIVTLFSPPFLKKIIFLINTHNTGSDTPVMFISVPPMLETGLGYGTKS